MAEQFQLSMALLTLRVILFGYSRLKEEVVTTRNKTGIGMNAAYNCYATFTITICKGKVEKLNRIWADTTLFSFDEIDYAFYCSTEDQNYDPFMSSIEGKGNVQLTEEYLNIVIKNFPLADYNNRVSVFTFKCKLH
ncbi:hypothetical protein [Wolbachia endosymbiont of Mansonella ozzardi]|uniref:hypothetical protein n=1 Tax=Wolbachia endosymbiont of Mansonella ozzardi TaxID=137464 RepID=UPI001CE0AAD1|nr:hypothetical protein [Wolbachia endosymbiont of Mansonella ozzardi]